MSSIMQLGRCYVSRTYLRSLPLSPFSSLSSLSSSSSTSNCKHNFSHSVSNTFCGLHRNAWNNGNGNGIGHGTTHVHSQYQSQARCVLTDADSGQKEKGKLYTRKEEEKWPKYKSFVLANHSQNLKRNFEDTLLIKLTKIEENTRTSFDKYFEKIFRYRIDGAGNWMVAVCLVFSASAILLMYRNYNDKLRLQNEDILAIKEELQLEVNALKQQIEDHEKNEPLFS